MDRNKQGNNKEMVVRKSGFREGGLYAQNFQKYTGYITTDGNGDGTTSVTFAKVMDKTPNGIGSPVALTTMITGVWSIQNTSNAGFTVKLDGSSVTSDAVQFSGVVLDDHYF